MNQLLQQIAANLAEIATELKRYNDAQGHPPSAEPKKVNYFTTSDTERISLREFIERLA